MALLDSVRRTIRRHQLAGPETRVLAAVSGGADSVALAHILRGLEEHAELRFVGVAHFNHQLRDAANDDERFCAALAAGLAKPFLAGRADVGAFARRVGLSVETAARSARYEFFEQARRELAADVVALGHTRDDQAETFLLRLLRGAGHRGLASMHPRNGAVIRPLLDCRRAELRAYLSAQGVTFIHDASNDDVAIPRNRVRAELLPFIEERFNPSIVDVLADEAELARDDHQLIETLVDGVWDSIVRSGGDNRWVLNVEALKRAPQAVARALVRRAMVTAAGGRLVSFGDVARALELESADAAAFDAPGQRVERIGPDVVLTGRPAGARGRPVKAPRAFHYALRVPGEVLLAEAGCTISAEVAAVSATSTVSATPQTVSNAVVGLESCPGTLSVRNRRPGDKFRPAGSVGRRKLQDFFVDRKVARERRDLVPIVVDELDRIVWVAGHAVAEEFRVTDATQAVIILRLNGVGGST